MPTNELKDALLQIEAETFEILDLTELGADLTDVPIDNGICSSSCSTSSCCSCSTSNTSAPTFSCS